MIRIDFYNNSYNKQYPIFNGRKSNVTKPAVEALLRKGMSPKEVAAQFGHNVQWGHWIIKKFELEPLVLEINKTIETQIIDLRKTGATIKTIAEIVNVSTNKIANVLRKSGVQKPRKTKELDAVVLAKNAEKLEKENLIKSELAKGVPIKEIVEKIGCTTFVVRKIEKNMDKSALKTARVQLKRNRIQELVKSLINDLKIGDNVNEFIENHEKIKNVNFNLDKQYLRKELCRLRHEKYTKIVGDLLKAGYLITEIANELNCSVSTVGKYANKAGFNDIKEQHKILFKEQITSLVNQGKKLKEIAEELNCSLQSIYNYFGNKSWKHLRNEYLQNRENEIYTLYQSGVSQKEIAQRFNISEDTVKRNIKRYQSRL